MNSDRHKSGGRIASVLLLSLLTALLFLAAGQRERGEVFAGPLNEQVSESTQLANCRYGVAALGDYQVDWVDDFGAGWFLNFGRTSVPAPNGAEYVSVIAVNQAKSPDGGYLPYYTTTPQLTDTSLGTIVDSRPGALWIVGNEVDRGPNPGETAVYQGDTFPAVYAQAYHDVYHFIKSRDPSAQVANSALVQVSPGRLQYYDLVWESYQNLFGEPMPVDVWNMHLYILPEVNQFGQPNSIANVALGTAPALGRMESFDPDGPGPLQFKDSCSLDEVYCYAEHDDLDIFAEQIHAMRSWMKAHGQRNKPLILSEFSILYPHIVDPGGTCFVQDEFGNCFTDERIINFMRNTFDLLEDSTDAELGYSHDDNRLVQQWLWFSVNHAGVGSASNLVEGQPLVLSAIGQSFRDAVEGRVPSINLFSKGVAHPVLSTSSPTGTVDAPLQVTISNNGNHSPKSSFSVAFYSDQALSQPLASMEVLAPGADQPGLTGCARRDIALEATWQGLSSGKHRYWVEINGSGLIPETTVEDNVISGFVLVNPHQIFVPLAAG